MKQFVRKKKDLLFRGAISVIAAAAAFFLLLQLASLVVWLSEDWFSGLLQLEPSLEIQHAVIHKASVLAALYVCGGLCQSRRVTAPLKMPETLERSVCIAIQALIVINLAGFVDFIAGAHALSTPNLDKIFLVLVGLLLAISGFKIWRYAELIPILSRFEFPTPSPSGKAPSRKYVIRFIILHAIIIVLVLAGLSLSPGLLSLILS